MPREKPDKAARRVTTTGRRRRAGRRRSSGAQAQTAKPTAAAAGAIVAITNATIHPITRPTIEKGTIVIRGTKIEALGANVPVPAGAKIVDAAGADVYPGFINARTQMGLNEPGARGFEDVNEMLDLNPQLRTRVAYHSESDAIAVARTNGITTVAVMPGGGTFGGEVAVMNLDGWTWEEATLKANAGITFNFPALRRRGRARGWRRTRRRWRTRRRDIRGPQARHAIDASTISRASSIRCAPTRRPARRRRSTGRSRRSSRSSSAGCRSSPP